MRSRDVKHPEGTCFATRGSDIVIFCIYLFVPVYNVFVCLCKLRRQHLVAACLAGQAGSVLGIFCTCFCISVFVYYVQKIKINYNFWPTYFLYYKCKCTKAVWLICFMRFRILVPFRFTCILHTYCLENAILPKL